MIKNTKKGQKQRFLGKPHKIRELSKTAQKQLFQLGNLKGNSKRAPNKKGKVAQLGKLKGKLSKKYSKSGEFRI